MSDEDKTIDGPTMLRRLRTCVGRLVELDPDAPDFRERFERVRLLGRDALDGTAYKRGGSPHLSESRRLAVAARLSNLRAHALRVAPLIEELRANEPRPSWNACARALNDMGVTTPRGKQWIGTEVRKTHNKATAYKEQQR